MYRPGFVVVSMDDFVIPDWFNGFSAGIPGARVFAAKSEFATIAELRSYPELERSHGRNPADPRS